MAVNGYAPLCDGAAAEEAAVDDGELFAGTTDEAGVLVIAGELGAVDVEAVYPNAGEGVLGLLRELEAPTEELAPPPLSELEPNSEPESPTAELIAVVLDGAASPALETTPALSGFEGIPSRPPNPEPELVGVDPEL